jgi:hypothetical protein
MAGYSAYPFGGTFQDDDLVSQSDDLVLEHEARSKASEKARE